MFFPLFMSYSLFRACSLGDVGQRWTMEWQLSGMVLRMGLITGSWRTRGAPAGERRVTYACSGMLVAQQPASAGLPWRHRTQSRRAKILRTQGHLLHPLSSHQPCATTTTHARRATHVAVYMSMRTTALRGDAVPLSPPHAARTTTAAAPMTTPSAMSMLEPAQW